MAIIVPCFNSNAQNIAVWWLLSSGNLISYALMIELWEKMKKYFANLSTGLNIRYWLHWGMLRDYCWSMDEPCPAFHSIYNIHILYSEKTTQALLYAIVVFRLSLRLTHVLCEFCYPFKEIIPSTVNLGCFICCILRYWMPVSICYLK